MTYTVTDGIRTESFQSRLAADDFFYKITLKNKRVWVIRNTYGQALVIGQQGCYETVRADKTPNDDKEGIGAMTETLITGISGQPQWVPCQVIEYGAWVKDKEGNPWQKVRVFIPPFKGTHIVSNHKLRGA